MEVSFNAIRENNDIIALAQSVLVDTQVLKERFDRLIFDAENLSLKQESLLKHKIRPLKTYQFLQLVISAFVIAVFACLACLKLFLPL